MVDVIGPLLFVAWRDHSGYDGGWRELDELNHDVALVTSVGWLTHETDEILTIVPHVATHHDGSPTEVQGAFTIVKSCIRSRKELTL